MRDDDDEDYEHSGPDEPAGPGYKKHGFTPKQVAEWERVKAAREKDPKAWWRRLPDRSGMASYTIMIRAPGDPERAPRPKKMADDPGHSLRWKNLNKVSPDEWRRDIVKLLSDGKSRTFNAIAVTLAGTTADIASGKNLEEGLWKAVENRQVEFTPESPVLFRKTRGVRIFDDPAKKEPPGYAIYDLSTTKVVKDGVRVGKILLVTETTLEKAKKNAKAWTLSTGNPTAITKDGKVVQDYEWDQDMVQAYTAGWIPFVTRLSSTERPGEVGTFDHTRPHRSRGYYEAVIAWGDGNLAAVRLTGAKPHGKLGVPPTATLSKSRAAFEALSNQKQQLEYETHGEGHSFESYKASLRGAPRREHAPPPREDVITPAEKTQARAPREPRERRPRRTDIITADDLISQALGGKR